MLGKAELEQIYARIHESASSHPVGETWGIEWAAARDINLAEIGEWAEGAPTFVFNGRPRPRTVEEALVASFLIGFMFGFDLERDRRLAELGGSDGGGLNAKPPSTS